MHPYLATSASAEARLHEIIQGLRESLQDLLHCYMVPTTFLAVKLFLLSTTGKLDRFMLKRLADETTTTTIQKDGTGDTTPEFVAPSTATEVELHKL